MRAAGMYEVVRERDLGLLVERFVEASWGQEGFQAWRCILRVLRRVQLGHVPFGECPGET